MKITPYRSQAQVSGESGSIFNPGVRIPQNLANFQAEAASGASKFLDSVSEWAVKKQELQDQSEIRKATVTYQEELNKIEKRLLFPDQDDTYSKNLSTKQREKIFNQTTKSLEERLTGKYNSILGTKNSKAVLQNEFYKTLATTRTRFQKEINRRTKVEFIASQDDASNERANHLSDINLAPKLAKTFLAEEEKSNDYIASIGGKTPDQLKRHKLDFRNKVLTNNILSIAQNFINSDTGVIEQDFIDDLRKDAKNLEGYFIADRFWSETDMEGREKIIDIIEKDRDRQLDIFSNLEEIQEDRDEYELNNLLVEMRRLESQSRTPENQQLLNNMYQQVLLTAGDSNSSKVIEQVSKAQNIALGRSSEIPRNDSLFLQVAGDINAGRYAQMTEDEIREELGDDLPLLGDGSVEQILNLRDKGFADLNKSTEKGIKLAAAYIDDLADQYNPDDPKISAVTQGLSSWLNWQRENPDATYEQAFNKSQEIINAVEAQAQPIKENAYRDALADVPLALREMLNAKNDQNEPIATSIIEFMDEDKFMAAFSWAKENGDQSLRWNDSDINYYRDKVKDLFYLYMAARNQGDTR